MFRIITAGARSILPVVLVYGFFLPASATDPEPGLKFIENKGQWNTSIQFAARVPGGHMTIGDGAFTYYMRDEARMQQLHESLHKPQPDAAIDPSICGHIVRAKFADASFSNDPLLIQRSSEYYNYFLGNDSSRWASNAYAYSGVVYPSIYTGVDLKVYSSGDRLKYDLIVAPGGDASRIRVHYEGADALALENGNLFLHTSVGDIIEQRPFAWQIINGEKIPVACTYQLCDAELSYAFPQGYDPCYELVIDPLLIFSTFSGSTADNWGSTATPGERGTLYSSGVTIQDYNDVRFPATPGAFQTRNAGDYDVGILKYDSTGSRLLYASYLGGFEAESPHSLVMADNGDLIVLGTTSSTNFPVTTGAFDRTFNGGDLVYHVVGYINGSDIFLARISKGGDRLIGSTYIGGSSNDGLNTTAGPLTRNYGDELRGDVITDKNGNILVSSVTASLNFPVANAIQPIYHGGGTDAVLFKFDAQLTSLLWSTYIGGSGTDASHTVKLDDEENIFIGGGTTSFNFPVTPGSHRTARSGEADGWIAKIKSDGSSILSATLVGGSAFDQVYFLDLNANEEVYVYGTTNDFNFPTTAGVYQNPHSGQFLQKFDNTLTSLEFSTVFGAGRGEPDLSPTAFLVNDCNNIYLSGWGGAINFYAQNTWRTSTLNLPISENAFQKTTHGSDFYFIVLSDDATQFLYATYLGGPQTLTHVDGGTSRFDKNGIVYHAVCAGCDTDRLGPKSDFPTTPGAWSRVNRSENCNNAAFKFDLSSLRAQLQTNSIKLDHPGLTTVCIPDKIVFQNFSVGGEIFEWDLGDGTKLTKMDTSAVIHQYLTEDQYLVKLKAIDHGTCKVVDSTSVVVHVNRSHAEVQPDAVLCFGDSYRLKASGGVSYDWKSGDGAFISSDQSPLVAPKDTTQYFVSVVEPNGCVHKDTVELKVVPGIEPVFDWWREGACQGRPFIHVRNTTDSLGSTDNLLFDFGDGQTSDLPELDHTYAKDGLYHLTLYTTREFCVYEQAVDIPVFTLKIPNVITPAESPGYNDTFTIQFGEQEGVTPADYGYHVSLKVYNRWGTVLFHTNDYQYDWSGEGLAAGVYYYDVEIEGHGSCKSWLQLMK